MEHDDLADDVAAVSAACLYSIIFDILKLEPPEAVAELKHHIHTAIEAYRHGLHQEAQAKLDWSRGRPSSN